MYCFLWIFCGDTSGSVPFFENKADSLLWNALIDRYHYLGYSPLSGAQIRHLIDSDRGLIGAIGFGAAACTLKARDRWIGWDRQQRERRREWVVNNRRFLILPWVRVKNLASHLLAKAARQIPIDFQVRYGYAPVLLETFVEQDRFSDGCYRAANWINVGPTAGPGRNDRTSKRTRNQHGAPLPIKQIWLYPLRRDARRILCGESSFRGEAAWLVPAVRKENPSLKEFKRSNPAWSGAMAKLKKAAEEGKIAVSRADAAPIYYEMLCLDEKGNPVAFEYELTRHDVERLAEPFIESSINLCKQALFEKRLKSTHMQKLLLVGGTSQTPYLQERLLDSKKGLGIALDSRIDPLTVFARGAAVFAGTQRIPN